jgi:glutathione S-transferase
MPIQLYDVPKSGHCHRVRLAASVMGVAAETISVMDMEGQRQGAAYLAINPFGQVPTMVDGDISVRDSIAIIQYLERVHSAGQGWMPSDPAERAQVDEWFAVAAGVMFRGPNTARLIKLFSVPGDYDAAKAISAKLFNLMEEHLQERTWLVGDRATLADVACYSYIAVANEGELDLGPYTNIRAWLTTVQGLDGFIDIPRS